jgi:trehalose-6-phosphatase
VRFGRSDHFEGNELVSTFLEAGDDLTDESALDTVGLENRGSEYKSKIK